VRGGGVIDGTEVMAIFISRHSSLTVGDVIALFQHLMLLLLAVCFRWKLPLFHAYLPRSFQDG
jgi:uncharacterized membrane-anchored protein YitT (DUF2179 family)